MTDDGRLEVGAPGQRALRWLAGAVLLAALGCDGSDEALPDDGLDRTIRFADVVMGGFWADDPDAILSVQRRFLLYEDETGGEQPVLQMPEVNSLAGRAGPRFFLGAFDDQGDPYFEEPLWLEIQVRRTPADAWAAMTPRCRLDPRIALFGLEENLHLTAGDIEAVLPILPMMTSAMLLDYPAEMLRGPRVVAMMAELMEGDTGEVPEPDLTPPRPFDAERWTTVEPHERWDMVEDLLNAHEFLGMTRAEVEGLLGPPAAPGFPFGAAAWDIVYQVGRTFLDSFWLFFKLDGDGRVSMFQLYED